MQTSQIPLLRNNNNRRAAICAATAVFIASAIPPFHYGPYEHSTNLGYEFIIFAPHQGTIDIARLAIEYVAIIAFAAIGRLLLSNSKQPAQETEHRSLTNLQSRDSKMRKPVHSIDPQARHDQALRVPEADKVADSATLEASLKEKNGPSMEPPPPKPFDPIASAMSRHPGLTSEEAAEMAERFGF